MCNPPVKMLLQYTPQDTPQEVLVYDFMHETQETFQTLGVCWSEKTEAWFVVPLASLTPIIEPKSKKKKLTEEVLHNGSN